jgi:hypothetical protein
MTQAVSEAVSIISARCEQCTYPPYDNFHGTPNHMLWRRVTIETPRGRASFEQTDYGHPGRLNPWEPRGVASPLLPRLDELKGMAAALASLH